MLAQIEAGASFEDMAGRYSEDPGSKNNGGKFDRWLVRASPKVDPYYLQAVFEIEAVGENSGLMDSNFGIHIIRLDGIREKSHLPFAEVKDVIIAELELEYKKLAAKEFDAKFRLTEKAFIDKAAMEDIFSPYQPAETPASE